MKKIRDISTFLEGLDRETPWYMSVYYWFYRLINDLRFFFMRRLPCFFHRGKNGYSYIDAWSIDYYLCDVIVGLVKLLKANLHGAPHDLFDDSAENPTWKWEEILDKIIEGFQAGRAILDMDYMDGCSTREEWEPKQKELEVKYNEGMGLFKEYFFHLWD